MFYQFFYNIPGKDCNLGMVPVHGKCGAKVFKKKVIIKLEEHFDLKFKSHILNLSNDGCSTMKKVGRLILPILQQLCLAHAVHLSVLDVFFVKKGSAEEESETDSDDDDDDEEDSDDESDDDDDFDEDDDDVGIIDEQEEEAGEFSDENLAALVEKCRKIINKYCGRSTNQIDLLQDAIKDWQRRNGMRVIGYQLKRETKTRWNSTEAMFQSILKLQAPLKKVMKDSTLALSDAEFEKIKHVLDVLEPVKDVVEVLCREDADLMTAEVAFNELFKNLDSMDSELAQKMVESLRRRVKSRWNPTVAGLLKYLHNPEHFKKPEHGLDEMFAMPSRYKLEKLAADLITRHYGVEETNTVTESEEVEIEIAAEARELSFAEKLQQKLNKLSEEGPSTPSGKKNSLQTALKKEFDLFQTTGERSKNLELLYKILQNIAPTSVGSERAFSNANDFVTKKRCRLSDKSIDNLCFLKSIFKD